MANEQDVANITLETYQNRAANWLFTFNNSLTGTSVDISEWLFEGQIRDLYDSSVILATMAFTSAGLNNNQVLMSLEASDTGSLPVPEATTPGNFRSLKFTYDIKATLPSGDPYTVQRGAVIHFGSVTP